MNIQLKDGKTISFPGTDGKSDAQKMNLATKYFVDTWLNGGETPDGEFIPWESIAQSIKAKDLTTSTELRALLSRATQTIIKEPIEPILAITGLFTKVRAQGLKTEILLGAIGAVEAGEVTEGSPYPEVSFDIGGGAMVATIGKSGIQGAWTDEALRYTTWDVMAMCLRMMAAAMARHTEWKAINFLRSMGQTLYDNARPTRSVFGVMTGRDMAGAANGTCTMDDLMTAYTHMVETGFPPDTLIMSPQMYFMWVRDPVLRHLFLNGNGGVYFATYTGAVAPLPGWSNGTMGGRGPSYGYNPMPSGNAAGEAVTGSEETSFRATSAPVIPGYLGIPLRIIVSPLIPYDHDSKLGDIYLVASGLLGYHLIDEDMTTVEWRDEDRELVKVKMKQRDSFAVAFDGQAIGVLRNVKNDRNHYHGDVQLTQSVSGTITEIPNDTAVV